MPELCRPIGRLKWLAFGNDDIVVHVYVCMSAILKYNILTVCVMYVCMYVWKYACYS